MNLFIKESYVYDLPVDMQNDDENDFERRWVICECGNGRKEKRCEDINDEPIDMIRFFKVNGVQTCERCLEEMLDVIGVALDEGS